MHPTLSTELALRAFEADASFSAALAAFQAELPQGIGPIEAARQATAHGFSWLSRPSGPGLLEVRLRHSGGADAAAEGTSLAELLAGLLGISMEQQDQAPEPDKLCGNGIMQPQQAADAPAPAAPGPAAAVDAAAESLAAATSGTVVEQLEPDPSTPLTAEQKAVAVAMIKGLTAAERQAFTISFRDAFRVDRDVKSIAPIITQLQHLHFCDRWSVEAAGGVAP